MGEAADDMFDDWLRVSQWPTCPKHRQPYDPEWGCEMCEEDESDGGTADAE